MSLNFTVIQPDPVMVACYTALSHRRAKRNPDRFRALNRSAERRNVDGLADLRYHTISLKLNPLYTHILVDLTPMRL